VGGRVVNQRCVYNLIFRVYNNQIALTILIIGGNTDGNYQTEHSHSEFILIKKFDMDTFLM
jgi:hypothetical protein